jgi:hypothetical protein
MSLRPPASSIWRRSAPALEGGEDELVVAPDEFVGPALDLPPAGVEAEFLVVALLLPRLVDVFEGLKGQDGGADFAGLAVPDEFDLAFVGEEEEAVFLGSGLPCSMSLMRSRFSVSESS